MTINDNLCPVCLDSASVRGLPRRAFLVDCPQCHSFSITFEAVSFFEDKSSQGLGPKESRKRANASAWIREQCAAGEDTELTTDKFGSLINIGSPTFHERADRLLQAIEHNSVYAGQEVEAVARGWIASSWCANLTELKEVVGFLWREGRIKPLYSNLEQTWRRLDDLPDQEIKFAIAPNGWAHLEKLRESNPESRQCFVAMWFHNRLERAYADAILPAIESAGFRPLRIDKKEHANKIDDEIIAGIRSSRFVVADFTGQRGGVYFEAGFAMGLNLPVIWTCRKDDIANLHFDIRQYNCIDWSDEDELRLRLTNRINAIITKR